MRVTVDIPPELLRASQERAAAQGETLSRLMQRALQEHLERAEEASEERFVLLEAGKPGGRYPSSEDMRDEDA